MEQTVSGKYIDKNTEFELSIRKVRMKITQKILNTFSDKLKFRLL